MPIEHPIGFAFPHRLYAVCFPDATVVSGPVGPSWAPGCEAVLLIEGIVLAAGRSRRMGQPKALLPAAGDTFLQRAMLALREGGCARISVVVGPRTDPEAQRIAATAEDAGVHVVVLTEETKEQIDSLRAALRPLATDVAAVVVMPVDFPRVGGGVVAALIEAYRRSEAPVVVPVHRGRHGHPVLFARRVFPELLAGPLPEGARSVVHAHASRLLEVPVDEDGVLNDVDTPADYQRIVGRDG